MSTDHAEAGAVGLPLFTVASLVLGWRTVGDVSFFDGGELGAAAFTLGVPHPTGFAVDMLVVKAASFVPLGPIGFRQNLACALIAAGALALLGMVADRVGQRVGITDVLARRGGAWIAASAVGAWSTFLYSALALEVYSSALCVVAACGYAALRGGRWLGPVCVLLGLSAGLHVTTAALGMVLLVAALAPRGLRGVWRGLLFRAPLVLAGALVLAYLPLASLRDPALDWGDPQTLERLWAHLSGARIRDAFREEMLGVQSGAGLLLFEQYAESAWLFAPALLGLVVTLRGARSEAYGVLLVLSGDLAYAAWVNPMGLPSRQVGHVGFACIGVFAALGMGWALSRLGGLGDAARRAFVAGMVGLVAWGAPAQVWSDDHAATELYGSGGALSALPPRSVLLCANDSACAGGLFAVHVERVRPDVEVLPVQHLWDPTTVRRVPELAALQSRARTLPEPHERAGLVHAALRGLLDPAFVRPVRFERTPRTQPGGRTLPPLAPDAAHVPYLVPTSRERAAEVDARAVLSRLEALARDRGSPFRAERTREAWASCHAALGVSALDVGRPDLAATLLARALQYEPDNPMLWTNLGVAQESLGRFERAALAARRAITLAPYASATPWVNLARLQLRAGQGDAARRTVEAAQEVGLRDARLLKLRERIGIAPARAR